MSRNVSIIILLCLGLINHGCSGGAYLDGSPRQEMAGLKMSQEEMKGEIRKLTTKNDELKRQIVIVEDMNRGLRISNAKKLVIISERNRSLNQQIDRLQKDNQSISTENEILKKKLASFQVNDKTFNPGFHKAAKHDGRITIKVLSGDGDLNSAKRMAKRLRKIGYTITSIDYAPRSNFQITTIYFAHDFKDKARRLGSGLGRKTVMKPLNWPSKFGLIVVTGSQK